MEIDITRYFGEVEHDLISASRMELGENVAGITWKNALDAWGEYPLLDTDEKRDAFRYWVADFGAWDREEIEAWTDAECNALFLQFVSGEIRNAGVCDGDSDAWDEYQARAERGECSGNFWRGTDGRIWYSLAR